MRVLILLLFSCVAAASDDWQSHDSIVAAARQLLASQLAKTPEYDIQIRPIDTRLTLATCGTSLVATTNADAKPIGNITVAVRCADEVGWRVFVNANIYAVQSVVIALRTLPRGTVLQASDVTLARWPAHQLRGAPFATLNEVLGLVVRNPVAAQEPLIANQLCLICKGDNVQLLVGDERFSVGIAGVAAGFAHLGERVEVINPSSRRHVYGVVTGPGRVQVSTAMTMR